MKQTLKYSRSFAKLFFNWILVGFPLIGMWHLAAFSYFCTIPADWVFQYKSILSTQGEYKAWEKIKMITDADWFMDAKVTWIDSLRCPPVYFVNQSISYWQKYEGDKARWEWLYQGETPQMETSCYIDSRIVASLPYGIEKEQRLRSNDFFIR